MSLLSYYWNERFSSCTLGWILSNLGDLLPFILLVSTFLLSDSSVWYRSSVLFLTVWNFCHGEPSPPKLFRDGDVGMDVQACLSFFFFFFWSCSAVIILGQPFCTLMLNWSSRFCQILLMRENMHFILSHICSSFLWFRGVCPHCQKIFSLKNNKKTKSDSSN